MPELPVVIMDKYIQKMDKTTFIYIKDLEHQLEDAKNQIETSKVGYMLVKAEHHELRVLVSMFYEACQASHVGRTCRICGEYEERLWGLQL